MVPGPESNSAGIYLLFITKIQSHFGCTPKCTPTHRISAFKSWCIDADRVPVKNIGLSNRG